VQLLDPGGAVMHSDLMDQQLSNISKRLYNLEQQFYSLKGPGGNSNFPNGITVGDPGITVGDVVNLNLISSPADNLTLTPGAFYGDIYVDVEWDAPADGSAHMYDVEWSLKNPDNTYTLVNVARIGGNSYRIENLRPQSTYGIRVYGVNRVGLISDPIPGLGLADVTTLIDSTIPSPVAGIVVFAAPHALIVRWNDNSDPDVVFGAGSYVVEVSTNATFTAIVKTSHVSGTIATFTDLPSATTYYVRVSAVDASGNQGTPTSAGAATTGQVGLGDMAVNSVGANQVVANSIATVHIAAVGLDAGTIKFGTMDGNLATIIHLKANNIDSSSITTATLTLAGGSLIAGSPPTTGLAINSQGLRLYSGGSQVVVLDSAGTVSVTGTINATGGNFTGTVTGGTFSGALISGGTVRGALIQTAASGTRLEIAATDLIYINFNVGGTDYDAGHVFGFRSGAGGTYTMYLRSPRETSAYGYAQLYVNGKPGGDSEAILEGNNIYLRKPGPAQASYAEINAASIVAYGNVTLNNNLFTWGTFGYNGDSTSDQALSNFVLHIRTRGDNAHRLYYVNSIGAPSNGTQAIDGPMLHGNWATGLGGNSAWGVIFRAYADNSGTLRCDSYAAHHMLNGLFVDFGTKSFSIDHPVLGPDYYLMYASIEGPRADLMWRGRVQCDKNGRATVDLDAWYNQTKGTFVALTLDDTIQMFFYNESGEVHPTGTRAGAIVSVNAGPHDWVGWQVFGERGDDGVKDFDRTDARGRLINEHKKNKVEKETSARKQRARLTAKEMPPVPEERFPVAHRPEPDPMLSRHDVRGSAKLFTKQYLTPPPSTSLFTLN
jgi:hypothetical protein